MKSDVVSHVVCLRHAEAQVNVDAYFSSAIPGTHP